MSANLERGLPKETAENSIRGGPRSRLGKAEYEKGEESVEEEESEGTEVEAALEGSHEASEALNLSLFNQPCFLQAEPNFLNMMEQMTQFMGQLAQEVSPGTIKEPKNSRLHKLRHLILLMVLYLTYFLTGRAGKWIEPYPSNISNEDPSYLLNNLQLFETQLFTLFSDPNEVRKAEQELENLMMKESGHVSLYIADLRSLISRIGDWGETAYINVSRRGLASRILDQLASYPGNFDTLQELMDITLKLGTRYHERKKEKGSN
ncbi:hypothetical protein O181_001788 [Austropuccinia psidii MF-1]|uniref:Retrotransposon gag domain-containing protein n=1 Tax=Austropuccinia psidii MF-1 TaxID=1389203 RepID=A0A9Q3BBI6_9BASI|nr:hypothetical protein [Austropuccinia psidii MF-1]